MDTDCMHIENCCQAADVTPYVIQSVHALDKTSAQSAAPHPERPEGSPYETIGEPGEYKILGSRSLQLPTVYDRIK